MTFIRGLDVKQRISPDGGGEIYLCHLSSGVSFSSQVDHGQGRADAQRGDEDVPAGV